MSVCARARIRCLYRVSYRNTPAPQIQFLNLKCVPRINSWNLFFAHVISKGGEGWLRFPDLWCGKKTLILLIFNSSGDFRWSPEGPVSHIHSPYFHADAPGIFLDLLRYVHTLKREWSVESNGKLPHLFIPSKIVTWYLSLQWKAYFGQNCNFGCCVCSERLALGRTLWWWWWWWWWWLIKMGQFSNFYYASDIWLGGGRRLIGISGSLSWSTTLMELMFSLTPVANFGEVRRAQLAKSTLLTSLVPLGSFQIF